jgi:nucleoside-diphosphate-sugar epimerase
MKQKQALVTGGAGFIGSNVVRKLISEGWSVRVIDDLSTGYISNLEGLDVEFIQASIVDKKITEDACKGVDVVFHLAACVGRQRSIDNPVLDSTINLLGTINVLEGMHQNKVPRIVYSSSAAVFGELMTPTISEEHPQNADSPYGVSKLAAEKMILAYTGIYPITAVCLRYFNIYGVHQRYDLYGNVIPIFAHRLFNGQPLTIYGDGEQTRDFVVVEDVAKANYLAAISNSGTAVYNMGCGQSITINQLARMMMDIAGIQTEIVYAPERLADVKHCRADITQVRKALGFEPETDMAAGLTRYLNWFKNASQTI